jgi:hypothetical protein
VPPRGPRRLGPPDKTFLRGNDHAHEAAAGVGACLLTLAGLAALHRAGTGAAGAPADQPAPAEGPKFVAAPTCNSRRTHDREGRLRHHLKAFDHEGRLFDAFEIQK